MSSKRPEMSLRFNGSSAEDIEAHLPEIDRTDAIDIPASMWNEFVPIIEATRAQQR